MTERPVLTYDRKAARAWLDACNHALTDARLAPGAIRKCDGRRFRIVRTEKMNVVIAPLSSPERGRPRYRRVPIWDFMEQFEVRRVGSEEKTP